MEQEMPQEYSNHEIETVSINSVHMEKKLVNSNCQIRDVCR